MRVTVVIPAYNEDLYIAGCLEALMSQSVAPDEVIVVDNNSTDNTAAIARSFGVTVLLEKSQGIIPARNAGFNHASGDIIARCDADSRPHADWIERIRSNFESSDIVGVTGTNDFYDAPPALKNFYRRAFTLTYFQGTKLLIGHEGFYGSNMAFKRSAWEAIKDQACHDDRLVHEDIDLAIHMGALGVIEYDPQLRVSSSIRAIRVSFPTMAERLAKWPRSRFVHGRMGRFIRAGRRDSSSARNSERVK